MIRVPYVFVYLYWTVWILKYKEVVNFIAISAFNLNLLFLLLVFTIKE